ncbi:MAG TPA: cache domain-containing protein [Candidatus Competibacteraceae bacterium]|nr:cache domain-containing protein [Candidatus Competibacteraceae bacterium]HRZ04824.1 cache domain-containing protein [Candidatus Competibacteraceae bacterium]HSA48128.1 cache domain-containing protein [Candidatus Competibacteraceae bacterium]
MMRKTALFTSLALILGAAPALAANDPNAATPDEVVTKVHEAVQHLNTKGLAGFSDFNNNKDARWVWKDSYVFVYSCRDNVMLGHPLRPDMVGKPILQMKDDKDHLLFQDMCKVGANKDGGWVEYWWPKPGEAKASRKISFVHSAEVSFKPDIQVGAGIYDDKLSVEELNKMAAQVKEPKKDAP